MRSSELEDKKYKRDWYLSNLERHKANSKRWRSLNQGRVKKVREEEASSIKDFLVAIREQNPCADCGGYFPYYVMEFDHTRGIKKSYVTSTRGWPTLLEELAKCDIVCANCHKIRTHIRLSNRKEG